MLTSGIDVPRLLLAGLAAGVWIVVSGMLMAGVFGYREMKAAFDAVGLPVPMGLRPFLVHTTVRLLTGVSLVALFVILSRALTPGQAMLVAATTVWLLGTVLPYAVIVEWGLFPWSLGLELWAWNAVEVLIAAAIGRWVYA